MKKTIAYLVGIRGVGKSTALNLLEDKGYTASREEFDKNPYLEISIALQEILTLFSKVYVKKEVYLDIREKMNELCLNVETAKNIIDDLKKNNFILKKIKGVRSIKQHIFRDTEFYEKNFSDIKNNQLWFMIKNFSREFFRVGENIIIERPLFETVNIFQEALKSCFRNRDINYLSKFSKQLFGILDKPKIIIWLKADWKEIVSRVKNRGRAFEVGFLTYLSYISEIYTKILSNNKEVYALDNTNLSREETRDRIIELLNKVF